MTGSPPLNPAHDEPACSPPWLLPSLTAALRAQLASIETPCFVFDLSRIQDNIRALQAKLQPDSLFYAVKCNSLAPVLHRIHQAGCGFEVNNAAELAKVAAIGADPRGLINSSPLTAAEDVRNMHQRGVRQFTVASFEQVENLRINAPGCSVAIRVYIDNQGSEFILSERLGIDPKRIGSLIKAINDAGLRPQALTFHVGSQCLSPSNWTKALQICAAIINGQDAIDTVNIGGGLPIRYHHEVPSLDEIGQCIADGLRAFSRKPRLYLEPGRFIFGNSACSLTSVIGLDKQPELTQAAVDLSVFSGLIEIPESGGHFQYPLAVINGNEHQEARYRLIGPTCSGTDILSKQVRLPQLKVDFREPANSSRILIGNTGAYTLDYISYQDTRAFNGVKVPKIFLIDDQGALVGYPD